MEFLGMGAHPLYSTLAIMDLGGKLCFTSHTAFRTNYYVSLRNHDRSVKKRGRSQWEVIQITAKSLVFRSPCSNAKKKNGGQRLVYLTFRTIKVESKHSLRS